MLPMYTIQEWLFKEALGQFEIDLGESGIQYHYFHDLDLSENYDLNYSCDRGLKSLRECVAQLYQVSAAQVMITHGSQEALYLFYQCLLKPHDHVITFTPGWQQSWEIPIKLGANVTMLALKASNQYQIDLSELKNSIKNNTRLIILNSPNNPLGTQVSTQQMAELIHLCREKNIFLINDEEYLTDYSESIITQYTKSAVVSGLSKVYGFPGLRLGWFIGPPDLVDEMVNYKRYVTVTNSSLCEYLGQQVLQKHSFYMEQYHELLKSRLALLKSMLTDYPSLKPIEPQNTPFVWIQTPGLNSVEFSSSLLAKEKVLVMPAELFGGQQAIRVSFVRDMTVLQDGLERLGRHFEAFYAETLVKA